MKIARFEDTAGETRYGVVTAGGPRDRVEEARVIDGDLFGAYRVTEKTVRIRKLLAPVDPPNVFAIGLNYADHARETNKPLPRRPLIFLKATTAVLGPGEPIVRPSESPDEVDYEAELAVVIGTRCRDVPKKQAARHILGYTCGNDVSARDCQMRIDQQWARAKSFDTFCPLGPWLVTPDELDPADLAIRAVLNGQTMQDSRTSQLVFNVLDLVSYLSRQFTLLPGTVIMTGTPPGVGVARTPPRFLRAGDRITVDIEGIGQLTNPVV